MDLHRKSLSFAVKAMGDDGPGTFEVYAAVFGNLDRQGDVIEPGAFTNLDAFVKDGWAAVNHDNWGPGLGIATIDEASQDGVGLKVRGTFHSTPQAQECRKVVKERTDRDKSVKCSVGFRVVDGSYETRDGKDVYVIRKAEVYEFSFVNLPANPLASVTSVKGAGDMPRLSEVKAIIDGMKAGRAMSKAMHGYLKAVHDSMAPACSALKALLDKHDPAVPDADPEPDGDPDDSPKSKAKLLQLRLRSQRLRSRA